MHIHLIDKICEAHYDADEPKYFEKEVQFFNRPERFEKGPSYYCSRFSTCYRARLTNQGYINQHIHIDATPNYLDFGIASRMKETFPPYVRKQMKLIVVLREPVGRLLSWYNHMRDFYVEIGEEECRNIDYCNQYLRAPSKANSQNQGNLRNKQERALFSNFISFEELFEMDEGAVNLGKYVDILEEFFDVFGMENFFILDYNFFLNKNRFALTKVSNFMDFPDAWEESYGMKNENERDNGLKLTLEDLDCEFVEKLDNFYSSYNRRLYQLLNKNRNSFPSHMPHFGQFEKLPKCSDKKLWKKELSE